LYVLYKDVKNRFENNQKINNKIEEVMARYELGEITTRQALIELRSVLNEIKQSINAVSA
jgi:hypothetical protein